MTKGAKFTFVLSFQNAVYISPVHVCGLNYSNVFI